jgi:3,2-trans-enoyl-CoA isomerase
MRFPRKLCCFSHIALLTDADFQPVSLYRTRLVSICAIQGFCPAAGTAIALCCDYRIAEPSTVMGLNEVALGIPVPKFWAALLEKSLGNRALSDSMLLNARMISSSEALKAGLLNEVAESADQVLKLAAAAASLQLKNPDGGRVLTKLSLRGAYANEWEEFSPLEAEGGWQALTQPATIKALEGVFKRLAASKPKL